MNLSVLGEGTPNAPSMQTVSIDGYNPEPVVATFEQAGIYRLPLASVYGQNSSGPLRNDVVGQISSRPNVYMPQWGAPTRNPAVVQTGGAVQTPISPYNAQLLNVNAFIANADMNSTVAQSFLASLSPRNSGAPSYSILGGA